MLLKTILPTGVFIETPSLGRLPTKAEEISLSMRQDNPAGCQPGICITELVTFIFGGNISDRMLTKAIELISAL